MTLPHIPKLVAFDFDGTLADGIGVFEPMMHVYCTENNLPIPDIAAIKKGYVDPMAYDFKWGIPREQQDEQLMGFLRWTSQQHISREHDHLLPTLFDEIEDLLIDLASVTQVALVTSRDRDSTLSLLDHLGIHNHFVKIETATCARDRGEEDKPAPDMLRHVLENLKTAPEDAVMIGDTCADMRMANAAGVPSIAVTWGAHDLDHLQDHTPNAIAESVADLRRLLL